MKTISFKAFLILTGLMLIGSQTMSAAVIEDFKKFVGTEFSSLEALYLMAGIIVASLVLYFAANHFGKQEEEKNYQHRVGYNHHRRHHHQHRVVKKTS